jgi:hypothetical protein
MGQARAPSRTYGLRVFPPLRGVIALLSHGLAVDPLDDPDGGLVVLEEEVLRRLHRRGLPVTHEVVGEVDECDVARVQTRLRHVSATTTLNTYAHMWPDADESTWAAVESVLASRHEGSATLDGSDNAVRPTRLGRLTDNP